MDEELKTVLALFIVIVLLPIILPSFVVGFAVKTGLNWADHFGSWLAD